MKNNELPQHAECTRNGCLEGTIRSCLTSGCKLQNHFRDQLQEILVRNPEPELVLPDGEPE